MSVVIDSYPESNETGFFSLDTTGNGSHAAGQTFTGTGKPLASAVFHLIKVGSPTGNAVAALYAISGTYGSSSIPTGSPLATSSTFNIASVGTSAALYELTFPTPATPTNGGHYALVLDLTGASSNPGGGNYLRIGQGSNLHSGNRVNYDDFIVGGWAAASSIDICFYAYAKSTQAGALLLFQ